jgi:cell wall-associated NlpC family hydrolase
MKWIIGIVVLLIAGWLATVYLFKRNGTENVSLAVIDSAQALQPLPDSSKADTVAANLPQADTLEKNHLTLPKGNIDTKGVQPAELVNFAKTQMGVPYLYGSTDPAKGFDCSGFITYVFKHFGIVVPRSSIDFTHVGKEVTAQAAKTGDLILFTGTDSTERFVGHMGIVVDNSDTLHFIHSTSGKQHSVTITPLNDYYKGRYVKTIRVFPPNG